MRPVILMTRPAPDGATTAAELRGTTGLSVIEAPLLEIRPVGELPPMAGFTGLIFTSRNGVRAYVALGGPGLPAICVGPATTELAQSHGFAAQDAGGDADALVQHIIAMGPQGALLHVRGQNARGDVAKRLGQAGQPCDEVVLYDQALLDLSDQAKSALSGTAPVIVPLYSPRTASQFSAQCPEGAQPHIVAISQAAALAVKALRAKSIRISETPDATGMALALAATVERLERQDPPD